MKRFAWLAGTAAVVLLIAAGLLLLLGNLYVQSPSVQNRIRRELSSELKMPAEVRKTTLTPWDGLRIDGVTAPAGPDVNGDGTDASNSTNSIYGPDGTPVPTRPRLTAKSFRARLAFGPLLLHRRLVVREVLLDTPELSWAQTPDGRWRWPRSESLSAAEKERRRQERERPLANASAPPAENTASPSPDQASPAPSPSAVAERSASGSAPTMIEVDIQTFRLRHGSAQFLDARGELFSRLDNVNLDGRIDPPPAAGSNPGEPGKTVTVSGGSGRIEVERATLRDWPAVVLTKFASAFTFRDNALDLTNGRAELAGGLTRIEFHLQSNDPGSPFRARCKLENVSLGQLCKDLVWPGLPRFVAGRLDGELEVAGQASNAASHTGKGQLRMTDIQLQNLPLLQSLGDVLRIEELSQLRFKTAQLDCRVEGEMLLIDALSFAAAHLRMESHGSCQLLSGAVADNVIDLQARLLVDRAVSRQLPAFVEDIFIPVENSPDGQRYIDFRINGPLGNPHNDLRDRVMSRLPLQELLGGGSGNNNHEGGRQHPRSSSPTPTPGGRQARNHRGDRATPTPAAATPPLSVSLPPVSPTPAPSPTVNEH